MNAEAQKLYDEMKPKLGKVVPDFELAYKAEIAVEINALKKEKNAVILGHNYMEPVLFYSIPDFKGDSLDLSRKAAQTDKDIIVFCGVKFMAETAKILNPTKTVLLPAEKAGCSLAESITAEDVRALKRKYPGVPVVTYVNTYADVKAESDICCTSGNAIAVVDSLKSDTVIFLPDQYLAGNVARETGKHIIFPTLRRQERARVGPSRCANDRLAWKMRGAREIHRGGYPRRTRAIPGCGGPDASGMFARSRASLRLFRQHECHDPLCPTDQSPTFPGADRMFHG